MKRSTSVLVVLAASALSILTALLAAGSAGAGHGDYFWAKVLYPYTMIVATALNKVSAPLALVSLLQYPAYIWAVMKTSAVRKTVITGLLLAAHTLAVLVCLQASKF